MPELTWTVIEPLREPRTDLEPSLADIACRMPTRNQYISRDHVTWSHEGTHGLNAQIRNERLELDSVEGRYETAEGVEEWHHNLYRPAGPLDPDVMCDTSRNAFYCLNGQAVGLTEPAGVMLRDVAQAVPKSLQGMSYALYLIRQQRWWNDRPLYLFDEWSAYANGTVTAMDGKADDWSELLQAMEFGGYALCLLGLIDDPAPLVPWVEWQWLRVMSLLRAVQGSRMADQSQQGYLARLRTAGDVEAIRASSRGLLSRGWRRAVLGDSGGHILI